MLCHQNIYQSSSKRSPVEQVDYLTHKEIEKIMCARQKSRVNMVNHLGLGGHSWQILRGWQR